MYKCFINPIVRPQSRASLMTVNYSRAANHMHRSRVRFFSNHNGHQNRSLSYPSPMITNSHNSNFFSLHSHVNAYNSSPDDNGRYMNIDGGFDRNVDLDALCNVNSLDNTERYSDYSI